MFLHFSAKKVECAKHQWIHLVGDQPESPHAFENFVVNARWRSTWVRVYNSLTLQSSYKPSMHYTMTCTTTHLLMDKESKVHTMFKAGRHRAPHIRITHRKPLRTAKATDPKELLMVLAPSVGSSKGHYQRI